MPKPGRTITHGGVTDTLYGWAKRTGIPWSTIRSRLDLWGWDVARALDTPPDRKRARGGRPAAGVDRPCPKLRKHAATGQAFARWREGGRDNTRYFGPWGSAAARESYRQFAAQWATGYRGDAPADGYAVADVVARWIDHARAEYVKDGAATGEAYLCERVGVLLLGQPSAAMPVAAFGPGELRAFRAALVARRNPVLARGTVNAYVARVVRCLSWGTAHGMVPVGVAAMLREVGGLKYGRGGRETGRKQPVADAEIETVLPHLSVDPRRGAVLVAMVRLQRLTGMRPGEVCAMRPGDLDRAAAVWVYTVPDHANKHAHRGIVQRYYLGPRAQAILAPILAAAEPGQPVFRTPAGVGYLRAPTPIKRKTYWRAVWSACRAAGVAPWHPHQLRHTFATEVARATGGVAGAAAAIGDTQEVAGRVYVHGDPAEAARRAIAERMG